MCVEFPVYFSETEVALVVVAAAVVVASYGPSETAWQA